MESKRRERPRRAASGLWVAIPHYQGRVSPLFDVASRLTLVRIKARVELERREVTLFETQPEAIARSLVELGVGVLVCGAISLVLERRLLRDGMRVVAGVCGEVDTVLKAFLSRTLDDPDFRLPGCFRRSVGCEVRKPGRSPGKRRSAMCVDPARTHGPVNSDHDSPSPLQA